VIVGSQKGGRDANSGINPFLFIEKHNGGLGVSAHTFFCWLHSPSFTFDLIFFVACTIALHISYHNIRLVQ
jgi:hypothetical protein